MVDISRILPVLKVCFPVFAVLATGYILRRRGFIDASHCRFANSLTYHIALPSLIFVNLARQPFKQLLDFPLIISLLAAVFLTLIIFLVLARILRLSGAAAAAFIYSSFWGNVSYIGFPLSQNCYGEQGLVIAAIVNASTMPLFIALAFFLIGLFTHDPAASPIRRMSAVFVNPVFLASAAGVVTAYLWGFTAYLPADSVLLITLAAAGTMSLDFLELLGRMGLPLALVSVGASLQIDHFSRDRRRLALGIAGKLVILPLLTLLIMKRFFPDLPTAQVVVGVMLMGTPGAVASSVISDRLGIEPDYIRSVLVLSTIISILTLPIWLFLLM